MEDMAPPQDAGPADPSQEDSYDAVKQEEPAGGTENGEAAPTTDSMNTSDEQGQVKSEDNGGVPTSTTGGNLYLRPAFLGNLSHQCLSSDVENLFNNPTPSGPNVQAGEVMPAFKLDRVDLKRGYAFVFFKDPDTQAEKDRIEQYVQDINGMNLPNVSVALRSEFARGDGRVKKKEDERRKKITPNETLFVVNFHEETTKREDLQMLFEPYGELVRIDMKRNYAFVQFKTVEEAIRAKESTNGGKLDQSEITVEFVARRMGEGGRRDGGRTGGGGRRYDDDRRGGGGYRGSNYREDYRPPRRDDRPRGGGGYRGERSSYDDRRGGYRRSRSPEYRRRSRSRSPEYRRRSRSRSPAYARDRDYRRERSRGGSDRYADGRGYGREY